MNEKTVRRGFVETDKKEFSTENFPVLKKALEEIYWLLNRGYPISVATAFVGNHYLLSGRQRIALSRAVSSNADILRRKQKEIFSCEKQTLHIDAFNIIIMLEVALSGSTLIKCMDGTIRDLAGLRGTYRLIDKTDSAITLIGKKLETMNIAEAIFYLDAPVSNSGNLKARILELLGSFNYNVTVELQNKVDALLKNKSCVVSSDAIILNECISWINLAPAIISESIPYALYIDFSNLSV